MAKILHVVNSYFSVPYFIGGQFVYFRNRGHQLYLICSPSEYLQSYSIEMGFSYETVEITRTYSVLKDLSAAVNIYRYITINKFDIVVGHTPKGALLAMVASWLCRTPVRIYFRHGLVYETARGFSKKVLRLAEKVTSFCSTRIVCVSPSLFSLSLSENLNPAWKQTMLGKGTCGGIDTIEKFNPFNIDQDKLLSLKTKYNINSNDYVIGFCGRLVKDKGIVELVSAFELLRSEMKDRRVVLLLAGLLEERDKLPEQITERIKKDNDIVFTGYINIDIQYYYAMMNVCVLPSYREGFGMSVIEASAMEKPVLTSKSTGCIDSIIENETGMYINITPSSIAEGVKDYINNPEKASSFGKNGREFVRKNFDNLIIWKELESLYH